MKTPCDVAVIGAGPAGCAAALAHARAGHRVLLLEASRRPPTRLAGEWIHPDGVAVLRRLGVGMPASLFLPALGFVVHPEDSSPPITLAARAASGPPPYVTASSSPRSGPSRRPTPPSPSPSGRASPPSGTPRSSTPGKADPNGTYAYGASSAATGSPP